MVDEKLKVVGYARVSTSKQDVEGQIDGLMKYIEMRGWELVRIYRDVASGKNTERDGFKEMLKDLEENPLGVQAVIIYKLDRIGRSLIDLLNISKWMKEHKIGLVSITNNIDTTTKEGRLFFYIMGSLAEYERELIIERTMAGLEVAKMRGKKLGRKRKKLDVDEIKRDIASGIPKTKVAKKYKVSLGTIYNILKLEEERKEVRENIRRLDEAVKGGHWEVGEEVKDRL